MVHVPVVQQCTRTMKKIYVFNKLIQILINVYLVIYLMNYFMNYLFFIYFSIFLHIINLFIIKSKKMDIVGSFMKAFFFLSK